MIIYFFNSVFLSTIDCFIVFSYSKVITLIQSRSFVNRTFNFEMYSLVIKRATLVNKLTLDHITMPALSFNIANVLEPIVEPNPITFSVTINNFFFFPNFYISSYNIHHQF